MQLFRESIDVPGEVLDYREIPSDLALVTPLVVRLMNRLEGEGFVGPARSMKVKLCLDEAITNAVKHGNQMDFDKMVQVWLFQDDDSWGVVIRDEGEGFEVEDTAVGREDEQENLWRESGRGIPLMRLYMDDCAFYDGGSTLLLRATSDSAKQDD